jgi:WD40 repeat protein
MELLGDTDRIRAITQLDDGRLCSATDHYLIKIWDLSTGECVNILHSSENDVSIIIQYSPTQLLCGGPHFMELLNLQTEARDKKVSFSGNVRNLELLPNGKIACYSEGGTIRIWSDGLKRCSGEMHTNAVAFAKLESDHLCTVTSKGLVSIWDYLTEKQIKTFQLSLKYTIFAMSTLQDKRICIQSHDYPNENGCLFICSLESEECDQEIEVVSSRHIQLNDGRLCTAFKRKITFWG